MGRRKDIHSNAVKRGKNDQKEKVNLVQAIRGEERTVTGQG